MKSYIFLLVFIFFIQILHAQENTWTASFDFGIQEHDKRLFDYPAKKYLLADQTEFFGTYQYGFSLTREISFLTFNKLAISPRMGLQIEQSTFTRPIDHGYRNDNIDRVNRHTSNYKYFLLPVGVEIAYKFHRKISLDLYALSNFEFRTTSKNTPSTSDNFQWSRLRHNSLVFYSGLDYAVGKNVNLYLGYRFFQLKHVDPIIFNDIIRYDGTKSYETYNPFKLMFSVEYVFEGGIFNK